MSEELTESPVEEVKPASSGKEKKPKAPKAKKRPSDFEIVRTILQRTCERKLPFLLRNIGDTGNTLLLCSEKEDGFTYGSASMSLGFVEFDDPELSQTVETTLQKLYGYNTKDQVIINLRDQISELGKTKGETMEAEVWKKGNTVWTIRKDVKGVERPLFFCEGIESLYHFQLVSHWTQKYKPLLTTMSEDHLYFPYTHSDTNTYSILKIPPMEQSDHPISMLFPNGFRTMVTKGVDMLISKMFEDHFPYPIKSEEIVIFITDGAVCQMAHRIIGDGWRMLVIRPNSYFFPAHEIQLPHLGNHSL